MGKGLASAERRRTWPSRNRPCLDCGKPKKSSTGARCAACARALVGPGRGGTRTLKPCSRCGREFWPWAPRKSGKPADHARQFCCPKQRATPRLALVVRTVACHVCHRPFTTTLTKRKLCGSPECERKDGVAKAKARYGADPISERARVAAYKKAHPDKNLDWGHRRRVRIRNGFVAPIDTLALRESRKTCTYCGCRLTATNRTIDHVIAVAAGGAHEASNLVLSCSDCNSRKSARPIAEWISMLAPKRQAIVALLCKRRGLGQRMLPLGVVGGHPNGSRSSLSTERVERSPASNISQETLGASVPA